MASIESLMVMVRGLTLTRSLTYEQALAIARSSPDDAVRVLLQALPDLTKNCHPVLSCGAALVMRLLWALKGPHSCTTVLFAGIPNDLYEVFVEDQLRHNPDQFAASDLSFLSVHPHGPRVQNAVESVQTARVIHQVNQLLENPRELSEDVKRVQERASSYNFTPTLNELLDKVEAGLGAGDAFDQAALLKHLRSFFEELHSQVAKKLHAKKPETKDDTDLAKCQQVIDYLERKDVFTKKTQALGRALYGILSEEGVHALESTREYVRLCRNMVAEYGLILFYELARRLATNDDAAPN